MGFQAVIDGLVNLNENYNKNIDDYNNLCDILEEKDALIAKLQADVQYKEDLLMKQTYILEASVEVKQKDSAAIKQLQAQLKELQLLDPKRLAKVNKRYKADIAELKERLKNSEKSRKETLKTNKMLNNAAADKGVKAFYYDPETKVSLRFKPNFFMGDHNKHNAIKGAPVVEYHNQFRGITREGFLDNEGTICWASATNTKPTPDESNIAKQQILDYCKKNKVKVK